jgi:hypothetical protein
MLGVFPLLLAQGGPMLQKSAKWAKPTKTGLISRENRAPMMADFSSVASESASEIGHVGDRGVPGG